MNDFGIELVRRWGIWVVVFSIISLIVIWIVAHATAAPGGSVSILWGTVQYTKRPLVTEDPPRVDLPNAPSIVAAVPQHQDKMEDDPVPREAVTLTVKHAVSTDNPEESSVVLRSERNLRELGVLESNKPLSEAPDGTFFFFLAAWLEAGTRERTDTWLRLRIDRFRRSRESFFELHKLQDGTLHVIAFVSESEAVRATQLNGDTSVSLVASPFPWGSMTSLLSIPVHRIVASGPRVLELTERETVAVLDIVTR